MAAIAVQLPLNACKKVIRPSLFQFNEDEKKTLTSVLNHLFPKSEICPGIEEINAIPHLENVIKDPYLKSPRRNLIKNGIKWIDETSIELFDKTFTSLDKTKKESSLRALEKLPKGEAWISTLLNYILEAMLGDPIYNINKNEVGWKLLNHYSGYPRPTQETKYKIS